MGKYEYEQIAIKSAYYINNGLLPEQAWEKASCELYEKGSDLQKKGCPKNAFLGLFTAKQSKNATYARDAVSILRTNPGYSYTAKELWTSVAKVTHNYQMDVVLALWNNKLIK